jgi:hypothetical protein
MIPARSRLEIGMIPVRSRFHHDFNHRKQGLNRETWGWSWHWECLRVHKTCGYGLEIGIYVSFYCLVPIYIYIIPYQISYTFAVAWSTICWKLANFYAGFTRHVREQKFNDQQSGFQCSIRPVMAIIALWTTEIAIISSGVLFVTWFIPGLKLVGIWNSWTRPIEKTESFLPSKRVNHLSSSYDSTSTIGKIISWVLRKCLIISGDHLSSKTHTLW